MFRSVCVFAVCLLVSRLAVADGPPPKVVDPPPVLASPVITVPSGVLGDGKRESPYTFDAATICVLMFPNPALPKFEWDVDDAVPGILKMPGNGAVAFNLEHPGEYFVQCTWEGGKSKAWILVKGSGPSPPPGPEDTKTTLTRRLKAAVTGADAKVDAAKLASLCRGVADAFESAPAKTQGDVVSTWKVAVKATEWPGGKYPDMPGIIRIAMPPGDEKATVSAAEQSAIIVNLRVLAAAANQIAGVK